MKIRERPGPAELATLPPQLRQYTDLACRTDAADLGVSAYPDRAAWLAARREWEAASGITCDEWFAQVCDHALRRAGLQAMNDAFSLYFTEEDEDEDPRLTA
jgi:hypothetical protein